jgi:hypothetical protein
MSPHYLWLTEGLELLTFFLIVPAVAIVIAYRAWRERENASNPRRHGMRCVVSGRSALLLFALANWIDAGVRTPQYFLQRAFVLLSLLALGVCDVKVID